MRSYLFMDTKLKSSIENEILKNKDLGFLDKMSNGDIQMYSTLIGLCIVPLGYIYFQIFFKNFPYSATYLLIFFFCQFIILGVLLYSLLSLICSYWNHKYIFIIIQSKSVNLSTILSLDISVILLSMWSSLYKDKFKDITLNLLIENIPKLIILGIFSTLYIFRNILIDLINLHMHKNNYSLRIDENSRNEKLMEIINKLYKPNINDTEEEKLNKIFNKLSQNGFITKEGLEGKLEGENINIFFDTFNVNKDHFIDEKEFKKTFKNILKHRIGLLLSLSQKDVLLNKFNMLLLFILTPLGFTIYEILQNPTFNISSVIKYIQVIVSLNFIFGSLAQDIFKSLNYILVVRIFDVGDILDINGEVHEVNEIGLLYSTFTVDSKSVNIANKTIMNYDIINYRLSPELIKEFWFRIDRKDFYKKKNLLSRDVYKLISKNKANIKEFKIRTADQSSDGEIIKACICVTFKLNYQNIFFIKTEQNEFFFNTINIFRRIKLKYVG